MNLELLEELCNTQGLPGYEEKIQDISSRELLPYCDEVYEDRMRNIIGVKKATRPPENERALKVMICAHTDEQGFRVVEVTSEGYIRLTGLGGPWKMPMIGSQIWIEGKEPVYGVLVPNSEQTTHIPNTEELLVYTGCDPEWVKENVSFGDRASWNTKLTHFNNDVICARNFDDRLGVFCMLESAKLVKEHSVDLYFVASVQEEIGTRGAMVATQAVEPDIGIAVDGGCVKTPMHNEADSWTAELGKGAAIYHFDKLTIPSRPLVNFLHQVADEKGIPAHANWWGGTDAHQLQKQGKGCHATTIGAPSALMHWPSGLANKKDIQAVTDLLAEFSMAAHKMGISPDPWVKRTN
jgi:tetrahedral aminopeptidase